MHFNDVFVLLAYVLSIISEATSITCYCTEDDCELGICDSELCVVGIKPKGLVTRRCESITTNIENRRHLSGSCKMNFADWTEVCFCDTPYCNTLTFLLEGTKHFRTNNNKANEKEDDSLSEHDNIALGHKPLDLSSIQNLLGRPHRYDDRPHQPAQDPQPQFMPNYDHGKQQQIDTSYDDMNNKFNNDLDDDESSVTITRQDPKQKKHLRLKRLPSKPDYSLVTVVVVSCTIMSIAISVVTLNYYCKLC